MPPLSECPAKTWASLHNTPCEHSPIPRLPPALPSIAALCQISDIYPPLNPNGRTSGSRSKFEPTVVIVMDFMDIESFVKKETVPSHHPPSTLPPGLHATSITGRHIAPEQPGQFSGSAQNFTGAANANTSAGNFSSSTTHSPAPSKIVCVSALIAPPPPIE